MYLTSNQVQSFIARCLYKFFMSGTKKSLGVLLEETVTNVSKKRYVIGWAFTLHGAVGYLFAPIASALQHRLNGRFVAVLGGLMVTIGYIGRALLSQNITLYQLVLLITTTGFGFGLINIATVISLKETFDDSFATVFSVSLMTSNIGIAVFPVILAYLTETLGYDSGMLVYSGLTGILIISGLLVPVFKKTGREESTDESDQLLEQPKNGAISVDNDEKTNGETHAQDDDLPQEYSDVETPGWIDSLVKVFTRHPEFILVLLLEALYGYGMSSWSIFLVPYCESVGFDSTTAVWLSSFGGLGGLLARFYCAVLYHMGRMNALAGLALPGLLAATGYAVTLFSDQFIYFSVMAFLSGFNLSVQDCFGSGMIASVVCSHHFRVAIVMQYLVAGVFEQVGGLATGAGVDITGSFRFSVGLLAAVTALQAVLAIPWMFHTFKKYECQGFNQK